MANFEALVDRIYEASATPDNWPAVMHDLAATVGAAGGCILTRRSDSWIGWRYSEGLAPGGEAYLRSAAAQRSQTTARLIGANRAGFVTSQELFTDEEYRSDPMITDWAAPIGLLHAAASAIMVPSGDFIVVQVQRSKELPGLSSGEVALLDAFRPHLARSGLLAARWRMERLTAAAEALALIDLPAAISDRDGRILIANVQMQQTTGYINWLPGDRLGVADVAARTMLSAALMQATDTASTSVRSLPIMGESGQPPAVLHVVPLRRSARDIFDGGYAVLVLTKVMRANVSNIGLLQGLFDLTPGEAAVAAMMTQGLSLNEIAQSRDVSNETVRSQAKSIFQKTGTSRQSDVASLLSGLSLKR